MSARFGSVPPWFDPDDERTAAAAWSRIAEPGDPATGVVVGELGPAGALLALWERPHALLELAARSPRGGRARGRPAPGSGWAERLATVDPVRDLRTVARFGGRFLVRTDAEWPDGLADLGNRAPWGLWVRGPGVLGERTRRAVAVVGSRASTGYGERVAGDLAAGLAVRGISVVSGAAYGIDAAAHRGALAEGGTTVAVLACGVDRAYPRGHEDLVERMAREGLVVSEVPPGSAPTRWRFVQRNRLIAALAGVTVVVEAGWRSGASITATEAVGMGRVAAAVPGPVTSAASAGCHRLLRIGATCVTGVDEVVELLSPVGAEPALLPQAPAAVHDGLDEVDLRVLDALPVRSGVSADRLAVTAGLDRATVTAALGRLQLVGLAASGAGLWRRDGPR